MVTDQDFDRYKATGGKLTRAGFFNQALGMGSASLADSGFLRRQIADSLGVKDEAEAPTLKGRIIQNLSFTG